MFPAQLIAHVPYTVIAALVGIVLVVVYEIDRAENNVVMERILSRIILPLSQFHVSLVISSINNSLLKKTPHLSFS